MDKVIILCINAMVYLLSTKLLTILQPSIQTLINFHSEKHRSSSTAVKSEPSRKAMLSCSTFSYKSFLFSWCGLYRNFSVQIRHILCQPQSITCPDGTIVYGVDCSKSYIFQISCPCWTSTFEIFLIAKLCCLASIVIYQFTSVLTWVFVQFVDIHVATSVFRLNIFLECYEIF